MRGCHYKECTNYVWHEVTKNKTRAQQNQLSINNYKDKDRIPTFHLLIGSCTLHSLVFVIPHKIVSPKFS